MNFTHPPQTEEQKDASIQLNNIGTINALNTHNWELQQKVQMLTAENERLKLELNEQIASAAQLRELIKKYLTDASAARKALGETE